VTRTPRQRDAERTAIRAAAERLLAGMPLRTASGRLTVTELIAESGLRRDIVYADHKDLAEEFQARVKAQDSTPGAMRELAERNAELGSQLRALRAELADERAAGAALRKAAAELSLELMQAKEELSALGNVTRLSARPQQQLSQVARTWQFARIAGQSGAAERVLLAAEPLRLRSREPVPRLALGRHGSWCWSTAAGERAPEQRDLLIDAG
jgi:hypothetical protein